MLQFLLARVNWPQCLRLRRRAAWPPDLDRIRLS